MLELDSNLILSESTNIRNALTFQFGVLLVCCLYKYIPSSGRLNRSKIRYYSVFGSVRLGSVLFGFFRKTEPNIYRIKSKVKGFHEVFNRNIFFFKNSVMREVSLLRSIDHSKIPAVMIE